MPTCLKCHKKKNKKYFYPYRKHICKSCDNSYSRNYNKNNKSEIVDYHKNYMIKNKEQEKIRHHIYFTQVYYPKHKSRILKKNKKFYKENNKKRKLLLRVLSNFGKNLK